MDNLYHNPPKSIVQLFSYKPDESQAFLLEAFQIMAELMYTENADEPDKVFVKAVKAFRESSGELDGLGQEVDGAGLDDFLADAGLAVAGDDDDADVGVGLAQGLEDGEAVLLGQGEVYGEAIGLVLPRIIRHTE